MDTSDVITLLSSITGNLIAVAIAFFSLRKSDKALAQAQVAAEQSLRRADLALNQAQDLAERALVAHWNIDGGATSVAWREQVFALHDRGLTPEQIRRIMLFEQGGSGWEEGNGRIDDLLRDL
ncbi:MULTISPECIES: hypothetical protein [unclassified Streptomyces]|jgi:hypothetical protein|uniref:hypothetical protein n=1 Tax=unclassified Streptomyces TaxID=2593676 RepID=UPI002DD8775B|nr:MULTISPECIES: hypothetical protein [unclassified Streptomyces]WRZ69710.1 hypothetical protein OG408_40020 [Streptomyces sp. NBC_01257]WSU56349.1 hypothetical protein OG450_00100 [Streptomyces sp. NBC_01104]